MKTDGEDGLHPPSFTKTETKKPEVPRTSIPFIMSAQ